MTKESAFAVSAIAVFSIAVGYAVAVFGVSAKANVQMRNKIAAIDTLQTQLSAAASTFAELQRDAQHSRQRYETWLQHAARPECDDGAYAEIVALADKHDIRIRKIEHQAGEATLLPKSTQRWLRMPAAMGLSGDWNDYLRFRSALMAGPCLLQSVSERVRADRNTSGVAVDLSLFVLQSLPAAGTPLQ